MDEINNFKDLFIKSELFRPMLVSYLIWYFAKFVEVIIWKFPIEDNHILFDPIWVG